MKTSSNKHLRRKLLCAIFAGIVAAPFAAQTAYALPIEGANAATNAGEANISTSGAVMDITGKTEYNVLRWEDFSIDSGEKVRFDNGAQSKDYLNLVTGEGASNIYGTIEGGRNIYLVNPHGILFAKGSEVNTGALYLSTANVDAVASAAGTSWGGNSPLSASTQYGNVLNLGTVQASKLYIEGNNVTVLNTDAVKDANGTPLTGGAVTIRSEDAPHIGYDVGNKITKNIKVGTTPTPYQVSDYASTAADHHKASAKSRGWDVANLSGAAHTDYDYMRVHDVYDLQNINANRFGSYILAKDIDDGSVTKDWNSGEGFVPLGSDYAQFSGRFDGARHTITGLYIRWDENYTGLFGCTIDAHIENLSLVDGYVEGLGRVGGIVGSAKGTVIRNVSYAGRVYGGQSVGGIVGRMRGGSIQNAWHAGAVRGTGQFLVGGIVGVAGVNAVIQNVCNTGAVTGNNYVGGIVGLIGDSTIQNVWNTGAVTGNQKVGGIVGEAEAGGATLRHAVWKSGSAGQAVGSSINGADVTTDVKVAAEADMKLAATYTDWKDEHGNAVVATEGGVGTPWRIYNGKTMPLLTALMKGTKRLEKTYDGKIFGDGDAHILSDTPLAKNVGTRDAHGIYSDAFGYDLIGSTYRIAPRVLTLSGIATQNKTYDGTRDADAAQFHATLNNIVAGEESLVSATATGAAYNSKDVASANAVNYTGVALGGTGAGNYRIASTVQGAGSITAKELNLALTGGARFDKMYDGTANVAQTLAKGTNYSLTGFIGTEGDHLALAAATGTYTAGKDAAVNKGVTFDGLSLTGTGAGNYTLDKTTLTGIGTITPRALTLGEVTAQSKTYDGTTAADAGKFRAALTNAIEGDNVTAAATGATYNDKNVARANRINYTGVALAGADAGNYSLAATTAQGAGAITRRTLTVGAVTAQTKTYDGTSAADAAAFRTTLDNVVAGEENSVTATATGAAYNDKTVAGANVVNYTGVKLQGTGAGNYAIADTAQGAGTITKRALTVGTVAAQSKTYDGTTAADASKFGAALAGTIAGDSVTAAAAGASYNDKNVTGANAVGYTGLALRGADAANYSLAATTAQGTGTITHRELTLTAAPHSIVQGEPLPSFTGRADGFADGEDERVFGADGLTFESAVTNTDTPGSYGVTGRVGGVTDGVLGNYRIRQAADNATAFTIYAAALPGGLLASLVQDAAPRFDFGFGDTVYLYGTARPIRAATLGLYRFDAEDGLEIQGLRL